MSQELDAAALARTCSLAMQGKLGPSATVLPPLEATLTRRLLERKDPMVVDLLLQQSTVPVEVVQEALRQARSWPPETAHQLLDFALSHPSFESIALLCIELARSLASAPHLSRLAETVAQTPALRTRATIEALYRAFLDTGLSLAQVERMEKDFVSAPWMKHLVFERLCLSSPAQARSSFKNLLSIGATPPPRAMAKYVRHVLGDYSEVSSEMQMWRAAGGNMDVSLLEALVDCWARTSDVSLVSNFLSAVKKYPSFELAPATYLRVADAIAATNDRSAALAMREILNGLADQKSAEWFEAVVVVLGVLGKAHPVTSILSTMRVNGVLLSTRMLNAILSTLIHTDSRRICDAYEVLSRRAVPDATSVSTVLRSSSLPLGTVALLLSHLRQHAIPLSPALTASFLPACTPSLLPALVEEAARQGVLSKELVERCVSVETELKQPGWEDRVADYKRQVQTPERATAKGRVSALIASLFGARR